MDEPRPKLFRVVKSLRTDWTIVVAESEQKAGSIAAKLADEAFGSSPTFLVIPISNRADLPLEWGDEIPWGEYEDPEERTCNFYLPDPDRKPPIDEHQQHALYQLLHGSVVLRPPNSNEEREIYKRFHVNETGDGVYFTTLKPYPKELRQFMVCYAIRPDSQFLPEDDS